MKKILVLFISVALLTACSGTRVVHDYDRTVDFRQYNSFSFFGWSDDSERMLNRFDKERIENAIRQEFEERGIRHVEKDGELIVSLIVVVDEKTERTATTQHYGSYGGYGYFGRYYGFGPGYPWGPGYSTTRIIERDYKVGTLVVDVFDSNRKELVWEGIGTKTVEEDPARRERTIPRAIRKIMNNFPKDKIARN
jgi:hypothetical protein